MNKMKTRIFPQTMAAVFFLIAAGLYTATAAPSCYDVIPQPRKITADSKAAPFVLSDAAVILFQENSGEDMARNAGFLSEYIE